MESFMIVCDTTATFVSAHGNLFIVTSGMIGQPISAPVWVKETILYTYLLKDGMVREASKETSEFLEKQGQVAASEPKEEEVIEKAEEPAEEPKKSEEETEEVAPIRPKRTGGRTSKGDAT